MKNMRQIKVAAYGIVPDNKKENTLNLRRMLSDFIKEENVEFVFEEGTYHFYPDYAVEKLLYISNHDEDTIKKIAFDLEGMKHIGIKGHNTTFMFHMEIIPFHIHNCFDIKIEGITVDYFRTGYSEGVIKELSEDRMLLWVDKKEYPYKIIHGKIAFEEEGKWSDTNFGCLEMDGERSAPVYLGHDISFNRFSEYSYNAIFEEAGENLIEVKLVGEKKFLSTSRVGNRLILRHHWRTHPCFYITDSKDIALKNITIYHCTGMAVIVQFTDDIVIEKVNVCRHPKKKRIFTATADGFHFVYAGGKIHIKDCLLENQLDDPVNIHGIYGRIHKVLSNKEVIVELVEGMQKGVRLGKKGEVFAVINNDTMLEQERSVVKEVTMLNKDYIYISFSQEMRFLNPGFVVENKSHVPDVLVEGCVFRNNRARGLLLTCAGETIVRDNEFETPGSAILIEGDSNYWFESGATKHILVENNRFRNCAYVTDWGMAPIQVSPSARVFEDNKRYHKCLEVRNNTFECFDERLVNARNLEKLIFCDNEVVKTDAFPPIEGEAFELDGVLETDIRL